VRSKMRSSCLDLKGMIERSEFRKFRGSLHGHAVATTAPVRGGRQFARPTACDGKDTLAPATTYRGQACQLVLRISGWVGIITWRDGVLASDTSVPAHRR
jgi:hypothetical protein